jgi:uncharacterized membrane protein
MLIQETHQRTMARAVSYRILAELSSFVMVGVASGIVIEVAKTLVYYVMERLWLLTSWQIQQGQETQLRIITRAVVYRVVATVVVSLWVGIEAALWLALVQTVLFYVNEIVWRRVAWGKTVATS